eukprot:364473-Chlamydomonas_euryale.AAC.4
MPHARCPSEPERVQTSDPAAAVWIRSQCRELRMGRAGERVWGRLGGVGVGVVVKGIPCAREEGGSEGMTVARCEGAVWMPGGEEGGSEGMTVARCGCAVWTPGEEGGSEGMTGARCGGAVWTPEGKRVEVRA